MTDQELNEWVARFLGYNHEPFQRCYVKGNHAIPEDLWNPCQDLNHAHLMEEKIREMGKCRDYRNGLFEVLDLYGTVFLDPYNQDYEDPYFKLLHASARQRVEAAYFVIEK